MAKYRYLQHIDTHIEVKVEANNEDEAREKAVTVVVDMKDEDYNQQLAENAEPGEDFLTEVIT